MVDFLRGVLHGALHPVHHVGVHHHGLVVFHPGGGDVVGVDPVGVRPAGVHIVAGGFHLLRGLIELVPVGHGGGHGLRIVGAQDRLGDGAAVDQHAGGGLIAQAPDLAVRGPHGVQGVAVLVGDVRVRDAQLGDGHGDVGLRVDIFQRVVGLHQVHVHPLVSGDPVLLQQRLVQLLLVDPVLGGVDVPVDLRAVFQVGDGFVVGKVVDLRVVGVEFPLELVVPDVDVEDFTLHARHNIRTAGTGAAAAQKAQYHHGHQSGTPNPSLHDRFLLFPNLIQPAAVMLSLL